MSSAKPKIGKCFNPHCKGTRIISRGLCHSCYAMCLDHVRQRRTTWEKMEKMHVVKPIEKLPMGPRRMWFLTGK